MKISLILFAVLSSIFSVFKKAEEATVDLGIVMMIGIAFAGLIVLGFIIWQIRRSLLTSMSGHWTMDAANQTLGNITAGFDSAVALIIVAITIFILALAISALLLLRAR